VKLPVSLTKPLKVLITATGSITIIKTNQVTAIFTKDLFARAVFLLTKL
jgi:hypothetical protein